MAMIAVDHQQLDQREAATARLKPSRKLAVLPELAKPQKPARWQRATSHGSSEVQVPALPSFEEEREIS
jgi:hypothetical protein